MKALWIDAVRESSDVSGELSDYAEAPSDKMSWWLLKG